LIVSAVAIAACGTALIFLQASNLVEDNSALYFDTLQILIFNSPAGTVWMIRIATSIIAAALAFVLRKAKSNVIVAAILVACAVSIFSNSMLSHNSAATFLPTAAILADWVHFMAVSSWVGGLFYFSAVLYGALKEGNGAYNLALALPRFSLIATASLGVIGVTGLYMAWVHLQSFDSLLYTQYGNNLIVKLSAVVPIVLLGAYHQVKLHKAVVVMATVGNGSYGQSGQDAVSRFGKTIKIESLVAIGVLLAASFLTITSPPSHAHEQPTPSGYSQKATVDGVEITLNIAPFNVGFNTFSVTLRESGGAPQNINAVFLRLTNMDSGTGPIITTLNRTSNGSYSTTGGFLSQAGTWDIDLIVQMSGAYDLNHSFEARLTTEHQMDMDESEHDQTHENSNVVEETTPVSPVLDSFAILAIMLSGAVIASSAYFYKKSQKQLSQTIKELEGHR
jgi:putative copper export protein